MGLFERVTRQWAGPRARIRKIGPLRMMIFNAVGDTITVRGAVESVDNEAGAATLQMWVESHRGKTVTCSVLVALAP